MVGTTGFEPATSRTPSVRATRLRYVPTASSDPVRVASTTFSVSLAFEKRQESAQRVAQIEQHFPAQKFRGIFRRRACGSRLHSAPSIFPQMTPRARDRK